MIERPSKPEHRSRKFKLWHMTAGVVVAAVIFSGIKALARLSNHSWLAIVLGFLAVWILACSVLIFLGLGTRLGDRVTRGLKEWGVTKGGTLGFGVFAVGYSINLMIALGTTAIGAFFVVNLFFFLFDFSLRVVG